MQDKRPVVALLILLLEVFSHVASQDTTFEITTTADSTPINVTCTHQETALQCAKQACTEHNLMETIEGLDCVEMLGDEIRLRRR